MPNQAVVAIVDDDPSVLEATLDLVEAQGFAAVTFANAADFMQSGLLDSTCCLIADVQMEGMSGIELHSHLRACGRQIPTILITGFPDPRDRRRALQDGVICYLAKPFADRELLACIQSAAGGAGRALPPPAPA